MTISTLRYQLLENRVVVVAFAAVLALSACGRDSVSSEEAKKVVEVLDQLAAAGTSAGMLTSTYSTVWSKAIEEREDFNVALATARDSDVIKAARSKLTQELKDLETKIRSAGAAGLAEEPLFEHIGRSYAILARLAALAETPSGNLQSFNQNVAGLESELGGSIAMARLFLPPEPAAK